MSLKFIKSPISNNFILPIGKKMTTNHYHPIASPLFELNVLIFDFYIAALFWFTLTTPINLGSKDRQLFSVE